MVALSFAVVALRGITAAKMFARIRLRPAPCSLAFDLELITIHEALGDSLAPTIW